MISSQEYMLLGEVESDLNRFPVHDLEMALMVVQTNLQNDVLNNLHHRGFDGCTNLVVHGFENLHQAKTTQDLATGLENVFVVAHATTNTGENKVLAYMVSSPDILAQAIIEQDEGVPAVSVLKIPDCVARNLGLA